MKNKVTLYFFLFLFTLFSCSDYRKIVKGDDYQLKFELSNNLYDKSEFDRCIILFEQFYQHSPKSPEGELSYFRLANSYFKNEDYNMAGYYFNNFVERFPYSKKIEDASFLVALCSVNNSPKYGLDQSELPQILASCVRPLLVIEDGPHTFEGSLSALNFFDQHMQSGEYIIVEDGVLEDLRYRELKNGPKRAIKEFLATHPDNYRIDREYCDFYGRNVTWNINGYLVKN